MSKIADATFSHGSSLLIAIAVNLYSEDCIVFAFLYSTTVTKVISVRLKCMQPKRAMFAQELVI